MKTKSWFIRFVSVLLSVVMIISIFTILPTSVFAAEKDAAAVSAEEDVAAVSVETNLAEEAAGGLSFQPIEPITFMANHAYRTIDIEVWLKDNNENGVTYQWYRVGENGDEAIDGATEKLLIADVPDTPGETNLYYCIVSRGGVTAKTDNYEITRSTEWDDTYMSGPIEDITLGPSIASQFGVYLNMSAETYWRYINPMNQTKTYRTNGYSYDDPTEVYSGYSGGYLMITDSRWEDGDTRYYYISFKGSNYREYRTNIFKVTKPAPQYDPTQKVKELGVGKIFSPIPAYDVPSWRDNDSWGIYQYKGAETYGYFFTVNEDTEYSLTNLDVTFYRCDNEDGTGNVAKIGEAHADDLSAYPRVNETAAVENGLKCRLPSDTVGTYYFYAEYSAEIEGVSFSGTTSAYRVNVEDVSHEDYFEFDSSTGTITGYYGSEDTVAYPASIGGVKVKKIRTTALTDSSVTASQYKPLDGVYRTCLKAVIPEGVEEISEYTFLGEKYLEEVTIPDSVTRIGRYSFSNCDRLKNVTVGHDGDSRLNYIEGGAFNRCDALEKLDFSSCGQTISSNLYNDTAPFSFLPALTEFIGPATGTMYLNFGTTKYPFNNSAQLKSIPNIANVKGMGAPSQWNEDTRHIYYMIRDDRDTADYDENYVYYPDEENEGWIIAGYRKKVVENDGELIFPDAFKGQNITGIGAGEALEAPYFAFGNIPAKIVFGSFVKEIGAHAFEDAFTRGADFSKKVEIVLPASLTTIGAYAFCHSSHDETRLGKVNISDTSVNYIGESAFKNQYFADFGELVFHGDVIVEDQAFMISDPVYNEDYGYINNDTLLSLTVEGSAEIGYRAFYRHNTLKSVSVNGTLTLDQDAFDKCYYIENVRIGADDTSGSAGSTDGTFGTDDTSGSEGESGIIDGKIVDSTRGFSHFRYTPAFPEVTDTEKVEGYTELNDDHKQKWERTYKRSDNIGYYIDRCDKAGEDYVQGTIAYTLEKSTRIVLPGRIDDDDIQIVDFTTLLDCYDQNQEYALNIGEGISLLLNTVDYQDPYSDTTDDGSQYIISIGDQDPHNMTDDQNPYGPSGHHGVLNHYYLTNCNAIHFPSTVKRIPSHFLFNAKLKGTVEIPGSVVRIDRNAFALNEIDTLILHEGTRYIDAGAFSSGICAYNGYGPASEYTQSSDYAFNTFDIKAPNVKRIVTAEKLGKTEADTFPDSLETIDRYAFADCGLKDELLLPAGITKLCSGAFYRTGVKEVVSEGGTLTVFGDMVFANCAQLRKADFSAVIATSLGEYCFGNYYGDDGFNYLYDSMGHSVYPDKIENALEELCLPVGLEKVEHNALFGVDPRIIHLPDTVTEFYVEFAADYDSSNRPVTYNGISPTEMSVTVPEDTTLISDTIFNLGTVTFLNRDKEIQTKRMPSNVVTIEDLPTSIPDYCTIRCYKNSFIYNWCERYNINYDLLADDETLAVRITTPENKVFSSSDLQNILWRDRTADVSIDGGRLYTVPEAFDVTHVYECEITFFQSDFNRYNTPKTLTFVFDPSAQDFQSQQILDLENRDTVTVKGSFGSFAALDGFNMRFMSQNGANKIVYPVEPEEDGSFTAEVPRTTLNLNVGVAQNVHYLPLTIKNVAYRDLNDEGIIDLGDLSLKKEPIAPNFDLTVGGASIGVTGSIRLYSADGGKSVRLVAVSGYVLATDLDDVFDAGDEVRIEALTGESSTTDYYSGVFALEGTKSAYKQTVEMTPVTKPLLTVKHQPIGLTVTLYNEEGNRELSFSVDTEKDVDKKLHIGKYTLVAVQKGTMPEYNTLQEFRDGLDGAPIAGYVEKQIELTDGGIYVFEDDVPGFLPSGDLGISVAINKDLKNKDGSVPMYISYTYPEENKPREGDRLKITLTYDDHYNFESPFRQVNGHFAAVSDGAVYDDEFVMGTTTRGTLTVTTDAMDNTMCIYVVPDGKSLILAANDIFRTVINLPGESFSLVPPPTYTSSTTGYLDLKMSGVNTSSEFFDGDYTRTITVLADGEECHSEDYTVSWLDVKRLLPYTFEGYTDGASIHTLQVLITSTITHEDGTTEDRDIWESEEYQVTYSPGLSDNTPQAVRLDMRIYNQNPVWDPAADEKINGADGVTTYVVSSSMDLVPNIDPETGAVSFKDFQLKWVLPIYINGKLENDITIQYALSVTEHELVDGDIALDIYCCESSPYIKTVYLSYNDQTGLFEGSLNFPGGTIGIEDLPYGLDIYVPQKSALKYSEAWSTSKVTSQVDKSTEEKESYTGELDEDIKGYYEMNVDLDEISYLLECSDIFAEYTDEEKQTVLDYASALKDLHEVYEGFQDTEEYIVNSAGYDFSDITESTDLDELLGLLTAGESLETMTAVPESVNPDMLKELGYTQYKTSEDTYYVRSDENGTSVICPEKNLEIKFNIGTDEDGAVKYTERMMKDVADTGFFSNPEEDYMEAKQEANYRNEDASSNFLAWLKNLAQWNNTFYSVLSETIDDLIELEQKVTRALIAESKITNELIEKLPLHIANVTFYDEFVEYKDIKNGAKTTLNDDGLRFLKKYISANKSEVLRKLYQGIIDAKWELFQLKYDFNNNIIRNTLSEPKEVSSFAKSLAKLYARIIATKVGKIVSNYLPYIGAVIGMLCTGVDMYNTYSDMYSFIEDNNFTRFEMFEKSAAEFWKAAKIRYDSTGKAYNCLKENVDTDDAYELMADFYKAYTKVQDKTTISFAIQMSAHMTNMMTSIISVPLSKNKSLATYNTFASVTLTLIQELEVFRFGLSVKSWIEEVNSTNRKFQMFVENSIDKNCGKNHQSDPNPGPSGHDPEEDDDDKKPDSGNDRPSTPEYETPIKVKMDPSGCVYEAVLSNRVEGATAKIYYKDDDGNAVFWDEAEDYGEINPQTTDFFGKYDWMTPVGDWKVIITKDGYYDADSSDDPAAVDGWLPVPPPQLDINIPLVSKQAPEVSYIAASDSTVAMVFSQYMDIADLEAEPSLITIRENGTDVPVSFTFTDKEESPDKEGVYYGRILRIKRTDGKSFSNSVEVSVDKSFKNYAGNGFAEDYNRTVSVGQIPSVISHSYPNRLVLYTGDDDALSVRVTDEYGAPVADETVTLKEFYGGTLRFTDTTAVTDENGVARFSVKAISAGDELLTFTAASGIVKTMNVRVKKDGDTAPEKPTVNLGDYSVVDSGTQLVITCDTEGAKIFYTTDDTCPCQESESQKEYTGPITLTESGFYRIAAYTEDGGYSERINLHIIVNRILGDVDGDNSVEIEDATWIQRYAADMELPFTIRSESADIDGDGEITLVDATAIQYFLCCFKTLFPIGETAA